jgi:cysteinyl-tRNA synthetase
MDDDFNVPEALPVLFELARDINRASSEQPQQAALLAAELRALAAVLGILQQDAQQFLQAGGDDVAQIEALIAERNAARASKDWPRADAARQQLTALQIELEDTPQGTKWRRNK